MEGIKNMFGLIGTMLSLIIYISPAVPFVEVYKGNLNYEETPGFIISSSYINCFCWTIYGSIINSEPIRICNLIGAIANLALICFYLFYEIKKYKYDAIINSAILILGSFAVYMGFKNMTENQNTIGKICIMTYLAVFLYPIQILIKIITEKNYNLIIINDEFISAGAYCCWFFYGIFKLNIYIIFPSIIGISISGIQIYLYYNLKKGGFNFEEKEFSPNIGNKNTKVNDAKKDEECKAFKNDEESHINEKDEDSKIIEKVDN